MAAGITKFYPEPLKEPGWKIKQNRLILALPPFLGSGDRPEIAALTAMAGPVIMMPHILTGTGEISVRSALPLSLTLALILSILIYWARGPASPA